MTNSENISADVSTNSKEVREPGDQLEIPGATLSKDGTYSTEICTRIASAMAATARLDRIWQSNAISSASSFSLYKPLVISILLYGFEKWTPLAECENTIETFETKFLRNFSVSPTWSERPTTRCRTRSISLWAHRNRFW